ncbi:MAG TPA: hypothetical protein VKB73_07225 [Gaiellaceae bacterium]|nr:hypothetical protein [Gaiellaceae bacterium]
MTVGSLVIARRVRGSLVAATLMAVGGAGRRPRAADDLARGASGCALWFVGGTSHGTKDVLTRTVIQEHVPDFVGLLVYQGKRETARTPVRESA